MLATPTPDELQVFTLLCFFLLLLSVVSPMMHVISIQCFLGDTFLVCSWIQSHIAYNELFAIIFLEKSMIALTRIPAILTELLWVPSLALGSAQKMAA